MTHQINIEFNGKHIKNSAQTLSELLHSQGFALNSHIATAVNGVFVSKTAREAHHLHEGDSVEVVAPMQGG